MPRGPKARIEWLIAAVALVVAALPLVPFSTSSDFPVDRALDDIAELSRAPHPMGSEESVRVRGRIVDELDRLGIETDLQATTAIDWFGSPGNTVDVVNVIARIPGSSSTGAVAVVGHYDTVDTTYGANDNSGAVAILLEVARSLAGGPAVQNEVILLFSDGEEPSPRFGSQAFVDSHPWFDDISVVINLEAVGSAGPSIVSTANGPTRWLIDHYAESAPRPAAFSFATAITDLIGGSNTDLAPFRDAGVAGIEFVYLRGSSIYHTEHDRPGNVGLRSLEQHGANTLALVRHLGMEDLRAIPEAQEAAFLTVGPGWVLRHGATFLAVAVALAGFGLVFLARGSWRSAIATSGAGWIRLLVTMFAFAVLWIPLGSWRSDMGIVEGYVYLAGLIALAVAIDRLVLSKHRNPVGLVGVWWLLGAALVGLPGLGYLFVWPAAIATVVLLRRAMSVSRPPWEEWASAAAVWITTLVVMVPAIETLFHFAFPRPGNPDSQILPTIVVPALLVGLTVSLLRGMRIEPVVAPEVGEHRSEPVVSLT